MPKGSAQVGIASNGTSAKVVKKAESPAAAGMLAFTIPYIDKETITRPLINESFGDNLAQDGQASGATELVHNGGDTVGWTPTAVAGTWDFADTTDPDTGTNHISITSAANNDEASFAAGGSISGSSYTVCRIRVNLQTYSSANNTMTLIFDNGGVQAGVAVNIDDYIDTATLGVYQTASISLSDLGIESATFDGCIIRIGRAGGPQPTIYFDNFQLRGGGGVSFSFTSSPGQNVAIERLRFVFIDNVTGATAKDYTKILGATLTNGITVNRTSRYQTVIGRSISTIADFAKFGAEINSDSFIDDGTNTMLVFDIDFLGAPNVLEGDFSDTISVNISDDLSVLLEGYCYLRGNAQNSRIEVIE